MSDTKGLPDVSISEEVLEGIRGRYCLLKVLHTEEIDSRFQNQLEDDMACLLSFVDDLRKRYPEVISNES